MVSPLAARCVVADARQIRLIANASVKTDAQDALRLANLLSVDMLPEMWVPPQHVRDVRALIAHRQALCKRRVIALNRIRSVLNRHNLEQPEDLEAGTGWLQRIEADLSTVERLLVADDLASLEPLNAGLAIAEGELARMSQSDHWRDMAPRVMQLAGIVHAMTVLGAIGDIRRFDSARQLAGYTGVSDYRKPPHVTIQRSSKTPALRAGCAGRKNRSVQHKDAFSGRPRTNPTGLQHRQKKQTVD